MKIVNLGSLKSVKPLTESALKGKPENRLRIALNGLEGSGKTRFLLTAPKPIALFGLDSKTCVTAKKVIKSLDLQYGKDVVIIELDDFGVSSLKALKMNDAETMAHSGRQFDYLMSGLYEVAGMPWESCRTIAIDTATLVSEIAFAKHFGNRTKVMPIMRTNYNADMMLFWDTLIASNKHIVANHTSAEIWLDNAPTGKYRHEGWKGTGYKANTQVYLYQDKANNQPRYCMDVIMSQHRPGLMGGKGLAKTTGAVDDNVSFDYLASLIWPSQEEDFWKE